MGWGVGEYPELNPPRSTRADFFLTGRVVRKQSFPVSSGITLPPETRGAFSFRLFVACAGWLSVVRKSLYFAVGLRQRLSCRLMLA